MYSEDFFSGFRGFERNHGASLTDEFNRLAISRNWKVGGKRYRKNRAECFASEFDHLYRTDGRMAEALFGCWHNTLPEHDYGVQKGEWKC